MNIGCRAPGKRVHFCYRANQLSAPDSRRTTMLLLALSVTAFGVLGVPAQASGTDRAPQSVVKQDFPARASKSSSDRRPPASQRIAEQYLVTVKDRASIRSLAADYRGDMRITRRYHTALTGFLAAMSAETATQVAADARVLGVDQDQIVHAYGTQTAPPWGLDRLDQTYRPLDDTYNHGSAGGGVRVYVVDTGVFRGHTQFGDRVVGGFDALGRGTTDDCEGHGTHVAGTIAGATYGVAKAARIVPVRVLACDGSGRASDIIAGLDFVARHHLGSQAAVVNMSIGGSALLAIDRAVNRVINDGVTVVTAAGNEASNSCYDSPARVSRAITVGATKPNDEAPYWSNFGPCLDVFAPGTQIVSAGISSRSAWVAESGTSMAAPHVAGVAARYLSQHPRAEPADVARFITSQATPSIVDYAGQNTVRKLLHLPGRAPTALSADIPVHGVVTGGSVTIRGTLENAWSGVTMAAQSVAVYRRPQGGTTWSRITSTPTDGSGRVSFSVEVSQDASFQLRHAATATTQSALSAVRSVDVDSRRGTTLALGSNATSPLSLGQTVTLTGVLRDVSTWEPIGGQTIELRRRRAGSATWSFVDSRTTDGAGAVAFTHAPINNMEYRLYHTGSSSTFGTESTIATVQVMYRVTSQVSSTSIWSDDSVYLTGRIEPVTSPGWASLRYRDDMGDWYSYEEEIYHDANGYFTYTAYPYWEGTHLFQVVMPGDTWNGRGAGSTHTVSVSCVDDYC